MNLRSLRKFFRHPDLPDETERLAVAKICANDEYDFPVHVILEETISEWRTTKKEPWIEFHFPFSYVIEGFSVHWWDRSHPNEIVVEANPVLNEKCRWQKVYVAPHDMIHHGKIERVTAVQITSHLQGQCFRLHLLKGTVDPIWNRFLFGIRYIELYGRKAINCSHNVFTKLAIQSDNTRELRKQRVLEQEQRVAEKKKVVTRGLIGWAEVVKTPVNEKVIPKCRIIRNRSATWQQLRQLEQDVRAGDTRMPLTYTVTPRLRRKYVEELRRKRTLAVDVESRYLWGAPRQKDNVVPKPTWGASSALALKAAEPGVATSSTEHPWSASMKDDSNMALKMARPGSRGMAKGIRPDSKGTVSTRAPTPLVKTQPRVIPQEGEDHFAAPTVMGSELPYGWVEYTQNSNGRPYYHNALSNETTWEKPSREPPLEPGWVAYEDDKGRKYYHQIATNEVTWIRPSSAAQDKVDGRHMDWQMRKADDGQDFFANPSLGIAQWEAPTMFSDIQDEDTPSLGRSTETDSKR
eukprot:GEMP01018393.1.p1 GENE.GEMP01018393.1~~GEMP01018393.1.p1  ORF type:complete len:529 (+),score=92.10 GEMP01018393.1:26-1588(+)